MVISYQEALAGIGSRYRVRMAVLEENLHPVGRGLYSTDRDEDILSVITKRYPNAILTGQTTLYAHGLVIMTTRLPSAMSARSCSRMYFAIVASLSPTVDT